MSRQEDFIAAGIQNHIHHCPQMMLRGGCAYNGDNEKLRSKVFEEGAEYGYQYAKKMIEYHLLCVELSNFFPTLSDEEADKGKKELIKAINEFLDEL